MQSIRNMVLPFRAIQPLLSMMSEADLSLDDYLPQQYREIGIPAGEYYNVLTKVASELGDESYHFSRRALIPGSKAFILNCALLSDNMLEALKGSAKSANLLYGGDFNRVEKERLQIHYCVDNSQFPYTFNDPDFSHLSMEYALVYFIALLHIICAEPVGPHIVKVCSRRPVRDPQFDIFSCLGVPVMYDSDCYRIIFDRRIEEMAIKPHLSEALLTNTIMQEFDRILHHGLTHDESRAPVSVRVEAVFGTGEFNQGAVASRLNMSVATLKRRLAEENCSFRKLRRNFMLNAANRLLDEDQSLLFIAEQLGFSDINSFGRAYKQWTGKTPASYRRDS